MVFKETSCLAKDILGKFILLNGRAAAIGVWSKPFDSYTNNKELITRVNITEKKRKSKAGGWIIREYFVEELSCKFFVYELDTNSNEGKVYAQVMSTNRLKLAEQHEAFADFTKRISLIIM